MIAFFKKLFAPSEKNTELSEALKEGAYLVDVRTPAEFASGSAPGAVNIPVDQVRQQVKKFRGKKKVILFCRSGHRAEVAKNVLEQNGIRNVLNGGSVQKIRRLMKN